MKLAFCLLRLPALLLALPLAASATIYKWTDEKGITVFSNRPPAAETKVANMQVVMQDDEAPAAPKPAGAPKPNNGNDLQERVRALEQQVQTLQTQASSNAAPYPPQLPAAQSAPPTSYYPPPDYYPPPSYPPPMYGYGYPPMGYGYPPMYGYGYPYYPYAYSTVVVAPRRFSPVHGFSGHRFGVRPVPVTGTGFGVGSIPVTRAMGVAHRR
jgi:uncharacterized protein DUF4124